MVKRRLLAAVLGLVMASTVACSSEPDSTGPLPDGAALLRDAAETSKGITSTHFSLVVTGMLKAIPVQSIEGDLTKDGGPGGAAKGTFQNMGDASRIYDPSTILDPDRGLAKLISAVAAPKTEGRETVNEVSALRVAGTVSKDVVAGIVPGVTADVEVKLWLREDNGHLPVRLWLQVPPETQGAGPTSVEVNLSDVGKPVTVAPPV